jgi:signal transduction histidine kinase
LEIYSNRGGQLYNNEIFYEAGQELLNISNRFAKNTGAPDTPGGNSLKAVVEDLQKQFLRYAIFFAIYDNGEWEIPPPRKNEPLFDAILLETGNHVISFDTTAVYVQTVDDAKIMAFSYNYGYFNGNIHITSVIAAVILLFLGLIILVFVINFFLTRTMLKNISLPLNTLSFGVRQIQNNNLSFRLEYKNADEFLAVCDAFNEMAARLEAMMAEHDKYEENRRELLAGISHDLRTPLTSIKAYLEGIEKEIVSTPEKREKYIATIRNKTNNMEHIINQLFLFSKLDINDFPISLKKLDMGQFIRDAVSELADYYAKRGLAVELSEVMLNAFVNIDPVLFHNVITNILENSVSYKDTERGRIEIGVGVVKAMVEIRLTDDGPGVPQESLEKLFDVFYRADPSRNTKDGSLGNGLGLAISQKIVNRMGGSIKAEMKSGRPERGLALVIYLPFANGEKHENFDY